jgi:hypothetical protein
MKRVFDYTAALAAAILRHKGCFADSEGERSGGCRDGRDDVRMTGWIAIGVSVIAVIVAGLSAHSADVSAEEARKSRLDDGGPIVTLLDAQPQVGRWVRDVRYPNSVPILANERVILHTPADGNTGLYVAARLRIQNEGAASAFLEFASLIEFEGDESTWPKPRSDGRFPLAPRSILGVTVFAGDTLSGWIKAGGTGRVPAVFTVYGTDPEVHDEFRVDLTGLMVDPVPNYDATWVLAAGMRPNIMLKGPSRQYPPRDQNSIERVARRWLHKVVGFVKDHIL